LPDPGIHREFLRAESLRHAEGHLSRRRRETHKAGYVRIKKPQQNGVAATIAACPCERMKQSPGHGASVSLQAAANPYNTESVPAIFPKQGDTG
jgi:hypothetical protein